MPCLCYICVLYLQLDLRQAQQRRLPGVQQAGGAHRLAAKGKAGGLWAGWSFPWHVAPLLRMHAALLSHL